MKQEKAYSKQRYHINTCTLKAKAIPLASYALSNQTQTPRKSPFLPEINSLLLELNQSQNRDQTSQIDPTIKLTVLMLYCSIANLAKLRATFPLPCMVLS